MTPIDNSSLYRQDLWTKDEINRDFPVNCEQFDEVGMRTITAYKDGNTYIFKKALVDDWNMGIYVEVTE